MKSLEVFSKSDRGRKRDTNEDSLLVKEFNQGYLLAVADGVGGHAAGEVASKLALIELEEFLKANQPWEPPEEIMKKAIDKANREIYLLAKENPVYRGMGTTLVASLVTSDKAIVANVGDSRAYLVGKEIKQVTKDHSLVQEMVNQKIISEEEIWHHPQKNIITKVLGTEPEVQPDLFTIDLMGKILLLCSDGLTNSLRDEEIRGIIVSTQDLETICFNLIAVANEKGGEDNISVILARENR